MSTLPIEKLLPWFPVCAFHFLFFCSHFYFDLFGYHFFFIFHSELSACCCHQQMIATFTPEGHLIPPQPPWQGGKKNLQAVNELPSMPRVKGVYKLTEAFVRALLLLPRSLSWSQHHFLSPLPLPPRLPPSHAPSRSSIFSLYLPALRSSGSVAGAALSGSGSEQHSPLGVVHV